MKTSEEKRANFARLGGFYLFARLILEDKSTYSLVENQIRTEVLKNPFFSSAVGHNYVNIKYMCSVQETYQRKNTVKDNETP